jgi:phage terminase small subunit
MLSVVGVLTPPDVPLFCEFCEATVVARLARVQVMRAMTGQLEVPRGAPSPIVGYTRAVNVLMNLGGRFGLTPADRSRLSTGPDRTPHTPAVT